MLSRFLAVPFLLGTGIAAILAFSVAESYSFYIIPQVVILAVIYMLSPQIDWWYYKKYPKKLDTGLERMLRTHFEYYKNLSEDLKVHFRHRVAMYIQANEFIPKPWDSVPEDIKAIIAANVIQLTFGKQEYRLKKYERIVVYPKPFPSPQYPRFFHSSEIFHEDGVLLFSAEQLMWSLLKPQKSYNIALHEYARVFLIMNPELELMKLEDSIWEQLEKISGQPRKFVADFVGLPEIDPLPVSISYFFTYPEQFKAQLPELFEKYSGVFNQNPTNKEHPVMEAIDYSQF